MILRPRTLILCLAYYFSIHQDRQCTYNATARRVRATVVAVEKQLHSEIVHMLLLLLLLRLLLLLLLLLEY